MTEETILLTGATGFIGRAFLDYARAEGIDRRFRLLALASFPIDGCRTVLDGRGADGLYKFHADDVRAAGAERIDFLLHLGAFTPKSGSDANQVAGSIANILNTRYLVEGLPRAPKQIVFGSTIDIYAPSADPIREGDMCAPSTLYGESKLFCETMLRSMIGQGRYTETSLQIVRIGHVYGRGEDAYRKFIPDTIRRLLAGEGPYLTTTGSERRSFIHVADCCAMIFQALFTPSGTGPITIASSNGYSLEDVARRLSAIAERATGRIFELSWATPPAAGRDVVVDTARMEQYLGRERISFDEGLRDEFEVFESAAR